MFSNYFNLYYLLYDEKQFKVVINSMMLLKNIKWKAGFLLIIKYFERMGMIIKNIISHHPFYNSFKAVNIS